ncbi:MAG: glycosyltransferase family 4 protein [Candidatus Marsarchaeota archaeon]|nr:glycosyltransferase family 4 protein [Candidatus Marsarchaeota archaeon]
MLNWRDTKSRDYGGAEMITEVIASTLAKRGHKVTLFVSGKSGNKGQPKGVDIIRKGSVNTVYLHAFAHMLKNRKRYDMVIESVNSVPFLSTLIFDPKEVFILVHHFAGKNLFHATNPVKAIAAFIGEAIIPIAYRNANFVALSKFVRAQLLSRGVPAKNISFYYLNYINPGKMAEEKWNKPSIITIGRLVRYKRVDMLIKIFYRLMNDKRINARLVIVGGGKEEGRLVSLCDSLKIKDKVVFAGRVSERAKMRMLERSWVFATASMIEGYGLSAVEAEACGLPAVAFANGGLKESIKNGYSGFLVPEGEEEAYANKLALLLSDAKLRKRMGRNARKYSLSMGEHGLDRLINRIEAVHLPQK